MSLEILKIDLNKKDDVDRAIGFSVEVLKKGGLVIHPTDTCYGIAADIHNKEAIKNVYKFKRRDHGKPLNIIVKNTEQFEEYGNYFSIIEKIIEKRKERMFSFVVPKKENAPEYFNPSYSTVGIQIPKIQFSLRLIENFGGPFTATSANLSGRDICYSIEELLEQFKEKSNFSFDILVLDVGALPKKEPSTVIEIIDKNNFKILRK